MTNSRKTERRRSATDATWERIDELRAWALSRIGHCDRVLCGAAPGSIVEIEREQERRVLRAVLSLIDGDAIWKKAGQP